MGCGNSKQDYHRNNSMETYIKPVVPNLILNQALPSFSQDNNDVENDEVQAFNFSSTNYQNDSSEDEQSDSSEDEQSDSSEDEQSDSSANEHHKSSANEHNKSSANEHNKSSVNEQHNSSDVFSSDDEMTDDEEDTSNYTTENEDNEETDLKHSAQYTRQEELNGQFLWREMTGVSNMTVSSRMSVATQSKVKVTMYNESTLPRTGAVLTWETFEMETERDRQLLGGITDVSFLSGNEFIVSLDRNDNNSSVSSPGLLVYSVNQSDGKKQASAFGEAWVQGASGVCFDMHNTTMTQTIATVDSQLNMVKFFNKAGDCTGTWKTNQIDTPGAIDVFNDGSYAITDVSAKHHSIKTFTKHGLPLRRFGLSHFEAPRYLCIDSKDRVIVSEQSSSSVVIFDKNGRCLESFGRRGRGNGQLNSPGGIAVDHMDNIFVADTNNHRIGLFSSHGVFIKNILSQLNYKPLSVAVNHTGHMVVVSRNSLHSYHMYEQKAFL